MALPEDLSPAWRLRVCMFGLLALELALIRWMGGQVRVLAYFQNLLLIASFLGIGLGVAAGGRHEKLFAWFFPAAAALAAVLAFAGPLGLTHMAFPDLSVSMWGADVAAGKVLHFVSSTAAVTALFWCVVGVFFLAALPAGALFGRMPPLTAYVADLAGSLAGVAAMTAAAALGTGPAVWAALGMAPFVVLFPRRRALACFAAVVGLAGISGRGALFSPYNRIDLSPRQNGDWNLDVNRDFHQEVLALSDQAVSADPSQPRLFRRWAYDIPFRAAGGGGDILVVGAGTGNDVAAALRNGAASVTAVEIDPVIARLGRRIHPDRPYDDPRVRLEVADARAHFERASAARHDVICYGLLDSHAMFSALSSLRLDNYVYTRQGIASAWSHLKDGGVLSLSFSVYAGEWMADRLWWLVKEATGVEPIVIPHGMNFGYTFLASRRDLHPAVDGVFPVLPSHRFRATPARVPTDDWPFLYVKPGAFPAAYAVVLGMILLTALIALRRVYGPALFSPAFDVPLFFMGAAFMLLETRLVTSIGLLFGSTWVVNAAVFGGVLAALLAATAWTARRPDGSAGRWYLPLFASLGFCWAVSPSFLNQWPLLARGAAGALLYAAPLGFAAVIFARLFRRAADPARALGANLAGAVAGGALEYLSPLFGLKAMVLVAALLYAASWAALRARRSPPPAF